MAIDPDVLATLPPAVLADGVSEALKTGAISDRALFDRLAKGYDPAEAEAVVARVRGHQAGSGGGGRARHRRAAAFELRATPLATPLKRPADTPFPTAGGGAGHAARGRGAEAAGFAEAPVSDLIRRALVANHLPVACPFSAEALLDTMLRDKKVRSGRIALALPREIGRCALLEIDVDALGAFLGGAMEGA